MFDVALIQTLGLIVVAAAAAALLARPLHVPTIVAFLIAGVVLGPVLNLLGTDHGPDHHEPIKLIAELGIVLLLFLVGLELSFAKIRDVGKVAVVAGLGQVVFTAAGGFVLAWLLGFAVVPALFLAVALTFSSTVVVVKVLDQKGELDSLYGRIAVGIFLVQDLVVIIMLTVLTGLGSAETMNVGSVAFGLLRAFLGMGLMLAIALIAARFVLPAPMAWASRSGWTLVIWSLALCLGFVELAHVLGLSPEIGAFLAGLSLAQLHASEDLRRRIHPLMDFFVAVFFVTLGAQMQFEAALQQGWAALVLSLFVLIGNPFIFMWIIARFGYSERTSFKTSVTVAQISEFSFVFAALGMTTGLIDQSVLSLTALVGLITIIASVYMILYSDQLYELCRRLGLLKMFRATSAEEPAGTAGAAHGKLHGHVIVVGMNPLGQQLARTFHDRGETVLAIDTDPGKLADAAGHTLVGDVRYLSVLHEANLAQAKLAITALKIEDTNLMFVYRCRQFSVPVAVHGFDRDTLDELHQQGATYVMDAKAASDAQIETMLQQLGLMPAC